jgi:uncharacterized membrane protein YhaH (DUF805 family)|tara:strand:+ start:5236 stop:6057 length:822 start_codon:yes stop_codon:yes gene_type:complete
MQWYLKVVRDNYANFSGRATRQEYWMYILFLLLFSLLAIVLDNILGTDFGIGYGWIYLIISIIHIVPSFAVLIRRLHDTEKSGFWVLYPYIAYLPIFLGIFMMTNYPILGMIISGISFLAIFILLIMFLIFLCKDGTPGPNRFGPSPKHGTDQVENELVFNEPTAETVVEQESVQPPEYLVPISLHVDNGPRKGSFYAVSSSSRIGRAPDNDIVLNVDTVSSYHAEIIVKDNRFFIKDLDSTNGTKINGIRVTESVLELGDKLQIGETELSIQ